MKNIPSKRLILAQVILIFILPVLLIYFNILPLSWRMIMLAFCSLLIYGIIRKEDWSYENLGFHMNNYTKAIPFYFSFTLFGVAILFLINSFIDLPQIESKIFLLKTFIFFIPISFFQEFAFRSFLIPRLKLVYENKVTIIVVNASLFALMHIIYPNLGIGLPLAFLSGIFFAWLYLKYPNLILVSISHAVLNVTAVLLGFFTIS